MCFGKAESTGGRDPEDETVATGSDVERAGCLRIDTGATPADRATEGEGEATWADAVWVDDRAEDAPEEGLDIGVGADAIRGGPCAL